MNRLEAGVNKTLAGWEDNTAHNIVVHYARKTYKHLTMRQWPSGKVMIGMMLDCGTCLEIEVTTWNNLVMDRKLPPQPIHPDYRAAYDAWFARYHN